MAKIGPKEQQRRDLRMAAARDKNDRGLAARQAARQEQLRTVPDSPAAKPKEKKAMTTKTKTKKTTKKAPAKKAPKAAPKKSKLSLLARLLDKTTAGGDATGGSARPDGSRSARARLVLPCLACPRRNSRTSRTDSERIS